MSFIHQEFGTVVLRVRLQNLEPLYCTASGKAVLAFLPEEYRDDLLSACEFKPYTKNTITNISDLLKELNTIRKQGYASDNCELYDGVYCIAAPVYMNCGWPLFSIGISTVHRTENHLESYAQIVRQTAKQLSDKFQAQFGDNNMKV